MAAVNGSERCVEYILQTHPESLNALDKHQVQCRTHLLWPTFDILKFYHDSEA